MDKVILVGEDEALVALDIENMLFSPGYEVVDIVRTGVEAVIKAGELQPDLVDCSAKTLDGRSRRA